MKKFIHDNLANFITVLRIIGSVWLLMLDVRSYFPSFFLVIYLLCGLTDVVDGWVARKLKTYSELGSKLDSISDILFYLVAVLKFDFLESIKNVYMRTPIIINVIVRVLCYVYVFITKEDMISRHTAYNKILGFLVFLFPFVRILSSDVFKVYIIFAVVIGTLGTIDEVANILKERKDTINKKPV